MSGEDRDLIPRARAGDEEAGDRLYQRHAGRVRAFLHRRGFADADADDLTQETFLRAFRSLESFDPRKGRFVVWIGAIARNVARRQWGRRQSDSFDPELAEQMFADEPAPADSPEAREELRAVGDCVAGLPAELQRIVQLRYVEGRTTRDVGRMANMPEATVRSRLSEARAMIERCLRGKGIGE